jgi:hypothetical protein
MPKGEDWRVKVPFADAKHKLQDGDLLQYRSGGGIIGTTISVFGRSPYSHSAMVCVLNDEPWRVEVREFHGGRKDQLIHDVFAMPGRIDVFRPSPVVHVPKSDGTVQVLTFDPAVAKATMLAISKPGEYGYAGVLAAALHHLPIIRWFKGYTVDDLLKKQWPPFCSQAYAYAVRQSFVDPVPFRPDFKTEPGDLTRSTLLSNYLFTLEK